MAAIAVLAVAFVVFAAIPAVDATDGEVKDAVAATSVGTEADLKSAIVEGFNVVLKDNIKLTTPLVIKVTGVIDLASYTLSSDSYVLDIYNPATVTVKASGDGKIIGSPKASGATVYVQGANEDNVGTFILDSGSIISTQYGIVPFAYGAVEVRGGTVTASLSAISGNGSETGINKGTGAKVTISGGVLTSTETAGVYFPKGLLTN